MMKVDFAQAGWPSFHDVLTSLLAVVPHVALEAVTGTVICAHTVTAWFHYAVVEGLSSNNVGRGASCQNTSQT